MAVSIPDVCLQALQRFIVTDLSNFYLDITKDRLYVRAADSFERRSCQTVLAALLQVCDCLGFHLPQAQKMHPQQHVSVWQDSASALWQHAAAALHTEIVQITCIRLQHACSDVQACFSRPR